MKRRKATNLKEKQSCIRILYARQIVLVMSLIDYCMYKYLCACSRSLDGYEVVQPGNNAIISREGINRLCGILPDPRERTFFQYTLDSISIIYLKN